MPKKDPTPDRDREWLIYRQHLHLCHPEFRKDREALIKLTWGAYPGGKSYRDLPSFRDAGERAKPYLPALNAHLEHMRKRWKWAPRSGYDGFSDLEDLPPDPDLLEGLDGGGLAPSGRAHWVSGRRLTIAAFSAAAQREVNLPANFFAEFGEELLAESLGAIRVDDWTTVEEIVAAYDAIQRAKDRDRKALGLRYRHFRKGSKTEPPEEITCPAWTGLDPSAKPVALLNAVYLADVRKRSRAEIAVLLLPLPEDKDDIPSANRDRDTVANLLKRARADRAKLETRQADES